MLRCLPVTGVRSKHPAHRQRSDAVCNLWFWPGHQLESRLIQESILRNRIAGLGKNRKTAVFPKLVFAIRDGLNHKKGDPNYDIKQLALECASKRMYPDILNYDQV